MNLLRERVEKLRRLPGQSAPQTNNWVLHYLAVHGHMPDGWEMVFGVPRHTGRRRKNPLLAKTSVLLPHLKESATLSANVNPDVRDVNPIPVPNEGGTRKTSYRRFRANLTSGGRTKHHHDEPHQDCPVYDPSCRDREWETPTWIGGTDWATRPLYRHDPPDVRQTFAQDERGLIPKDKPLAPGPPGFIPPNSAVSDSNDRADQVDHAASVTDTTLPKKVAEAVGFRLDDPIGLVSKVSSDVAAHAKRLRSAWLSIKSGESGTRPRSLDIPLPPRRRRFQSSDSGTPRIFATKFKPGTPEHAAQMYRQAIELRRIIKKPVYIVDYDGRRLLTTNPQRHGKIVHVVEATTTASFPTQTAQGTTFYGRRGLKVIEKERRARMHRASSSCAGYDPKCRDKEWEVEVPTGGVNLSLVRR